MILSTSPYIRPPFKTDVPSSFLEIRPPTALRWVLGIYWKEFCWCCFQHSGDSMPQETLTFVSCDLFHLFSTLFNVFRKFALQSLYPYVLAPGALRTLAPLHLYVSNSSIPCRHMLWLFCSLVVGEWVSSCITALLLTQIFSSSSHSLLCIVCSL